MVNKINSNEYKFYAQNFYPEIFEVYEKLNNTLSNLIKESNDNKKTDVVIEIDGGNGVLAALCKSSCNKFYSIQQFKQTVPGVIENAIGNIDQMNDRYTNYLNTFFKLNKYKMHMFNILKENDSNSRICVVFQAFEKNMINYDSKNSKHY